MSVTAHDQLPEPEIAAIVAGLRASFNAGVTRSSAWRRKTLLAFQRMMREKRGEMCAALRADLNKSPAQAWMTELNSTVGRPKLKGVAGGETHRAWANYLSRFLAAYAEAGVPFWGLTVQNEPAGLLASKRG